MRRLSCCPRLVPNFVQPAIHWLNNLPTSGAGSELLATAWVVCRPPTFVTACSLPAFVMASMYLVADLMKSGRLRPIHTISGFFVFCLIGVFAAVQIGSNADPRPTTYRPTATSYRPATTTYPADIKMMAQEFGESPGDVQRALNGGTDAASRRINRKAERLVSDIQTKLPGLLD